MINYLRRLYIVEKHLMLALKSLEEGSNAETRKLIYNALSSIGQLQEIYEQEYMEQLQHTRKERKGNLYIHLK